jgi:hypothetical protein
MISLLKKPMHRFINAVDLLGMGPSARWFRVLSPWWH